MVTQDTDASQCTVLPDIDSRLSLLYIALVF